METTTLSEAALSLLRRRMGGERVPITDDTRPAYQELVEAGLMIPLHTFFGGNESAYRPTEAACAWKCQASFLVSVGEASARVVVTPWARGKECHARLLIP